RWLAEPVAEEPITVATGVAIRAAGGRLQSAPGGRARGGPPGLLPAPARVLPPPRPGGAGRPLALAARQGARAWRGGARWGRRGSAERRRVGRGAGRRCPRARHGRTVRVAGDRRPARSLMVVLRRRGGAACRRVAGVGADAMTVGVVSPGMLLLLLAVPLVVLVGRRRRDTLWATVLRALAAVAVIPVPAWSHHSPPP